MQQHDPQFAAEVSDRLAYIDKFESGFEYADAMVHGNLKYVSGHIQECLVSIQARLQWGCDKYECSDHERLSAEQNCEVVIAADEYYRKSVSEPPGSKASWNARDQHMTTSMLRIQAHLDDPKMIVWAHNSHVCDATATDRGGASFESNETWNLGQMTRATFGADKTWIIGQYTFDGHVTAAKDWGGAHSARALRPALEGSYEEQMHALARAAGGDRYWFVTDDSVGKTERAAGAGSAELAALVSGASRLQRWVGVSYKPETERQSHYGELMLPRCYDQVVFIDRTSALRPVDSGGGHAAGAASCKRLLKEYKRIVRKPPPGIEAHPLEENILEWHFLLRCEQEPYAGGEYHGLLEFPPEYPMRPPAFKMLTPSGRFHCGVRLCMSMSDYHPESWNPSWSVETLLVGLQSFMYETGDAERAAGSCSASSAEREQLAAASQSFNSRNEICRELFGGGGATAVEGAGEEEEEETTESACRFCFGTEGHLVSPCACQGTNEWVHFECLRKWQKSVLDTQPTHPKYQTDIDRVCNVCLEPFTGEGIPPSRHDQIVSYASAELAAMVQPGNLLVSSRDSSREKLELLAKHPEVKERLAWWMKSCFLMISVSRDAGDRGGHMIGVCMSLPVDGPPNDAERSVRKRREWSSKAKGKPYTLAHWDGGPMNREAPLAVVHDPTGAVASANPRLCAVAPCWVVDKFDAVEAAVLQSGASLIINVVWGVGSWGMTQVLAETAPK